MVGCFDDGMPHDIPGRPVVGDDPFETVAFGRSGLRHSAPNQSESPTPRIRNGRAVAGRCMTVRREWFDQPSGRRGGSNSGVFRRTDHHHQQRGFATASPFKQSQLDSPAVEGVESASIDDHRVEGRRPNRGLQAPSPRRSIVFIRKDEERPLEQSGIDVG